MQKLFAVSYCIISQESAENGDVDEQGMVDDNLTLRDAVKYLFRTRTNEVDGIQSIEANCYPLPVSGWLEFSPCITVYNGLEYRTGDQENRSMSPRGKITASSWARIVRLIKGA